MLIPDPLAMAVTLDPALVVAESIECWATVETSGKRTRGMVIIDYDNLFAAKRSSFRAAEMALSSGQGDGVPPIEEKEDVGEEKKLRVVTGLNMERVQHWLMVSTTTSVVKGIKKHSLR